MRHKIFVVIGMLAVISAAAFRVSQSEDPSRRQTYNMFSDFSRSDTLYLEPYRAMNWPEDWQTAVRKVWLDIKALNPQYADPNVVMPGDTIRLPIGIDIAKRGGKDHMWHSAQQFVRLVVYPYSVGATITAIWPDTTDQDSNKVATASSTDLPQWAYVVIGAVIAALVAIALLQKREKRRKNFVVDPPSFDNVSVQEIRPTAERALRTAFGDQVEIVGSIQKGRINGTLTMFNRDGSSEVVTFNNEEGYSALVRFTDGQVRQVVCRYSCFNPCANRTGANFNGTFTPEGAREGHKIPVMTDENVAAVTRSILNQERPIKSSDLPGPVESTRPSVEVPPTPNPVVESMTAAKTPSPEGNASEDGTLEFTELQVSCGDYRFTAKGAFKMSFDQMMELNHLATGTKSDDTKLKAKPDAPAAKVPHPEDPHHTT